MDKKIVSIVGILVIVLGVYMYSSSSSESSVETIKVGYLPLTDHFTLMTAYEMDMFDGITVEPIKFSGWPALAEALASGQIDGAHMLNTLAIKQVSNGYKGKTVALSHRGDIALVVGNDVETLEDLKGKTIAVPSRFSSHYFMLHNYLTKNGFDMENDIELLDVSPPDFLSTMASGSVDAFIGSEPFPTLAESKGIGKTFALWDEMEIEGMNGLDCVVVFKQDLIDNNPEIVQSYVDGVIEAGQFIEENPLEAATVSSKHMLNLDPELIVRAIDEPRHRSSYGDLVPKSAEYEVLQNYMLKIGSLSEGIDMSAFVDDSFAKKSYEKLGLQISN